MADDLVSLPDLPFSSGFHCFPCFDLANLKYELMHHVQMQVILNFMVIIYYKICQITFYARKPYKYKLTDIETPVKLGVTLLKSQLILVKVWFQVCDLDVALV